MISLQSLRTRLGLLLVLAFGPIFGLTVYWSYREQANRLAEVEASEARLARQVATTYGQTIQRSREVLVALSSLTEVRRLDGPRCGALFTELLAAYQPQYENLDAARPDGELFCSAQPLSEPINVAQSQAFRRAVESRGFAIGDFRMSRITGRPMLTMALPVLDERGEVLAVIGALLSVDWLNQLAGEFSLPEGAALAVVDRSGHVVVRQPDPAKWVGLDVRDTPLFAARLRGEPRLEALSFDGVRRRFVIAAVEGVPPPAFLSVSVGIDLGRVLAPFHPALYRDLGILFAVAFAAFATAWLGTERSVIRRVNALVAATRRLTGGDLSARAGAGRGGPSELQQLGAAFDDMAAALEERAREMSESRQAFAEQEALLRTVIETLPVGVWIVGADGMIVTANRQAREIWGGLKQVGIEDYGEYKAWWTATGERVAAHEHGVARALRRGEYSSSEIIDIEAFDGERKTIAQWAAPLHDAKGRIAGAVAVNQDITARRRAEAALRESEERFRNMAEHLPFMIWVSDAVGATIYINQRWYEYTGQAPATGLGFGWITWLHPDDASSAMKAFLAANAQQEPFHLEYRARRHDGEFRYMIDSAAPRLGPAGEFLGYVGCVVDIHERKQAEERFRLAVEAAPSAMIMADERGAIAVVNSQTERLFGYTRGELLGQSVDMLLPERFRPVHPRHRYDFFRTPAARAMGPGRDLFGLRKDGREVRVEIGLNPIHTEAGEFVLASVTDITERMRVEGVRASLEAQLRQAQKMEALGTLAGGIAHDFNNILGTIMGNVELARQDVTARNAAEQSLGEIGKASERGRDLVQQILTFSRQQPLERRVLQLRGVAEESVRLLRATLPAGIELVSAFSPDAPEVLADRTQIHQVLMNLCTNAWQSIEGPVGRIEIGLSGVVVGDDASHATLRPGRYARLTVIDTGTGMDKVTVERIFDPFFTTKAPGEGTGLGLAVVDGIVKNHDGTIAVYSAPGRGTVFHLYFPAVDVRAELLGAPASELPRGNGQRILYIDDEEPLVIVATRLLGRLGYKVRGFTRPTEALAAFQDDPEGFDLCVTDLNMPMVSGLQIAAEILRQRPDLPVALASGYVTEALHAEARALGIRELIYKPSTVNELAETIQRMLTGAPNANTAD